MGRVMPNEVSIQLRMPASLETRARETAANHGYGSVSEFMRHCLRRECDRYDEDRGKRQRSDLPEGVE